jgi:hypothetical protein
VTIVLIVMTSFWRYDEATVAISIAIASYDYIYFVAERERSERDRSTEFLPAYFFIPTFYKYIVAIASSAS